MTRTRAYTRHALARAKRRAYRKARAIFSLGPLAHEYAIHNYRDRCPCSCSACGNPRRHFGERTMQERRAEQWEKY
jgi:hypothetical protein